MVSAWKGILDIQCWLGKMMVLWIFVCKAWVNVCVFRVWTVGVNVYVSVCEGWVKRQLWCVC